MAYIGDEIAHHALPPFLSRKGAAHVKRRRFKQTLSLSDRLVQDVEQLKTRLAMLPPGPERDRLLKRIRQNETAANIDQWLKSPGLQPAQELGNLGK